MIMTFENIVLVVAGILSGLLAGVFYTFNVAIVPALRSMKPTQHIRAMQLINEKIKNPVFFLSFFGPTILLPLAAFQHQGTPQFPLLVAAAVLHILGSNGVTAGGNIPLNERLDKVDVNTVSEVDAERIRSEFQGPGSAWMRLHAVRTLAAIAAAALVLIVCLSKNRAS
jgi:uncharacterized membrane protein